MQVGTQIVNLPVGWSDSLALDSYCVMYSIKEKKKTYWLIELTNQIGCAEGYNV